MEEIMNMNMRPPRPATLATREDSHSISKPKPKIRIVHIFAPEIIKTDAANFRELVQRLTGKPTKRPVTGIKKKARRVVARDHEAKSTWRSLVKGEEEEEDTSGGYLSGLGDVDGFLQGFTDFPMFPLSSSSSHMDHMIGVGEAQVI